MDKEGRSHRRHSSRERSVSRSYSRRSPSSHSYSRSDRRSSDRSRRRESSSDRRSHRHSSHNDRDRSSSRYRDRRRDESRRREREVSQSRSRRREDRSEFVEPNQGKITINKTFKGFKLQKPVTTGGLKRPSVFNVDSKKSQTSSKSVFLPFKNSKNNDLETKEQSSVFEVNSTPTTTKEEEVEDLDALMAHYADEAQKDLQAIHEEKNEQQQETEQVASDHNVISFEDFLKGNEEDQEDHEEEDNDDLKQFMSDIAKKQEEEFQAQNRKEQEQKQASTIGYNDSDNDMDVMDEELNESELTILDHSQRRMQKKQLAPVDHSKIDYLPIKKDFFILPSAVKAMTEKEIEAQRRNWNMRVKGNDCPPPIFTWDQTYLNDKILYTLKKNNYEQPFPIQCQSIPAVMKGRDVIAIARTGSGKTLAYLLPMFKHILSQPPLREGEGPIAIIMAPARELVTQIYKEAQKFTSLLNMKIVAVYGGSSVGEQINSLKKGCDIVVCTPGRMIDLLCLNSGRLISFTRISFVVLDEADRMLDDGFEPQINMILNNIRPDRQMVMFSATFPPRVEQLARDKIQMPLIIMVGGRAEVAGEVDQHVEVINKEDKWFRLLQILGEWESKGSILIFVDKQEKCDQLLAELNKCGHYALVLHGSMDQIDREQSISDFKNGLRHIMIATSVAGRGLDVRDLKLVINFDCPNHLEDYVHRVGRTGRAGDLGTSYTFITPEEQQYAPDLVKALRTSKLDVPDDLRSLADDYERKIRAGEAKRHMDQYRCTNGYTFSEQEEAKNEYDKKQQSLKADMDAGLISTEAALAEQKQDEELLAQYNVDVGHASSRPTESIITTIKKPKPVDFGGNRERKDALAVLQKLDLIKIPERMITQVVNGENIYLWKVPINDYPSKVRVRIMSRTELNCISEATDTSLTVRGEYIPNMTQMLGREPLHIAVESKSEYCVHAGVKMLKNTINEITQELGYNDLPTTGRFTVV